MKLSSKIKFANNKIKKAFEELLKSHSHEKKIHNWLIRAFKDIEENAFCGIQIPKRLIPQNYQQKYNINNL